MVSAFFPSGAGRIPTGTPPHLARFSFNSHSEVASVQAGHLNLRHTRKFTVRNASGMTKGSALTKGSVLTGQPLTFFSAPTISNRNFWRLEIPVTPTKQTAGHKPNRNFRSTKFAPKLGSPALRDCRNAAHSANSSACTPHRSSTHPPCPRTSSSPSVKCALFASAVADSTSLNLPLLSRPLQMQISNRNWIGLEISVTHSKHSPDLISNRNKNSLISPRMAPIVDAPPHILYHAQVSRPPQLLACFKCLPVNRSAAWCPGA
jgi:hypothetical protein